MPKRNRQAANEALIIALACGATVEQAARQAGMSRRTAQRRLADKAFQQQLRAFTAEMVKRTTGMLTAAAQESVKTLLRLHAASNPPGVQLGAARSVLQLSLKQRESCEFEERLAEVERRFAEQNVPPHDSG
jgi:hypothetical protein